MARDCRICFLFVLKEIADLETPGNSLQKQESRAVAMKFVRNGTLIGICAVLGEIGMQECHTRRPELHLPLLAGNNWANLPYLGMSVIWR